MKKCFWFRCKIAKTGEETEVGVLAKDVVDAAHRLEKRGGYITLEYTGWTEGYKEEKNNG